MRRAIHSSQSSVTAAVVTRDLQFRAGQRVRHATFGEGLVIESRADGSDEMVTVHFEDVGLKRLMVSFAHLERLEG
jgi:DNA helicase-2/ATP-dependent DNA helicase PcrA